MEVLTVTDIHIWIRGFICLDTGISTSIHRRRINTGEKAKVVAAVWGTEFIQFLAALANLLQDFFKNRMNCTMRILKNRMNSFFSSNHQSAK